MANTPAAPVNYDVNWDGTKPYYNLTGGGKQYLSPVQALGIKSAADADGKPVDPRITSYLGGASASGGTSGPAGSLLKTRGEWNPATGKFDQHLNYSNILSMAVGGALTGGAVSALSSGAAAGGTAPGLATAAGAPEAAATSGTLASAAVPGAGMIGAVPGAGINAAAVAGSGGVMSSVESALAKKGVSSALSEYAKSSASNRGAAGALTLDAQKQLEDQLLAREQENRRASSANYRDAMVGNYAQNWQPTVRPAGVPSGTTPAGSMLNTPGMLGQQQRVDAAGTLYQQALAKMKAGQELPIGDTTPPTFNPSDFTKSGTGEKLAGYAALAAKLFGY